MRAVGVEWYWVQCSGRGYRGPERNPWTYLSTPEPTQKNVYSSSPESLKPALKVTSAAPKPCSPEALNASQNLHRRTPYSKGLKDAWSNQGPSLKPLPLTALRLNTRKICQHPKPLSPKPQTHTLNPKPPANL